MVRPGKTRRLGDGTLSRHEWRLLLDYCLVIERDYPSLVRTNLTKGRHIRIKDLAIRELNALDRAKVV